jgi:hypothetical protein
VKAKAAERFWRAHILPHMPDCRATGRLLLRCPLGDVLRGCYLEDSQYDASTVTVEALVLPLYVPAEHLALTYSIRLARGSDAAWTFTKQEEEDTAATLINVIRKQAEPLWDAMGDALGFFENASLLTSHATNVHVLEARAYSALRARRPEARALIVALDDILSTMTQSLAYVHAMRQRAERILALPPTDSAGVMALLDGWRAHTVAQLRLGGQCDDVTSSS